MKEVLKALFDAKASIKNTKLKKEGYNDYSKYNYWTPEQVDKLVSDACADKGIITLFSLKRDQFGEFGELTITHIESNQSIELSMATAVPQITATNAAQQLGGCMTYTERYLKMSAFGIHENDLDPDSKDNSKRNDKPKPKTNDLPWLNPGDAKWDAALSKKTSLDTVLMYYKMSKANQETYNNLIK